MKLVEQFLRELALRWTDSSRPTIRILGSTALMLRTDYARGTKDSDILETNEFDEAQKAHLLRLAGRESVLARRWHMYVDFVPNGLPLLPHAPRWHRVEFPDDPHTLRFEALDVVDVVVSKLRRFHADDQSDIRAMIERQLCSHAELLARFRSAIDIAQYGAQAQGIPRCIEHFHTVERDLFDVAESEIEWTDWG